MGKVICVGNAVVDIIVKNGPDKTPDGMTRFSENISMYVGGDAVNEAVSLKAMGNDVKLYTVIGNDSLGDAFLEMIRKYGLPADGIRKDQEYSTTATVVTVEATGEHGCMTLRNGAAGNMRYSHEQFGIDFTGADLVSVASLFWSRGQRDEDLTKLFAAAKEAGAYTMADMVLDQSQMSLEDIAGAMKYIDFLVPSYHEASYFTGKNSPEEIAAVFHEKGVKTVVLKMGAEGVFASSEGKTFRVGTIADKVVDTLGAGDNFVAGFITGIVDGLDIEDALYFGSAASAIAIGQYGANGAIKSKKQVQEYLDTHRK
ncbi:MAG: carbohydrate kinase family protein [Lachnospiraceae bacterium]|nr:carbohydrate kinase family protein [Lachnospiraceae bacterium]